MIKIKKLFYIINLAILMFFLCGCQIEVVDENELFQLAEERVEKMNIIETDILELPDSIDVVIDEETYTVFISWTSNNVDIIDDNGNIYHPSYEEGDAVMTLGVDFIWNDSEHHYDLNVTVKALPKNEYTIIWKNYDGEILETDLNVALETLPTYDGITPTKPADEETEYIFSGWSPEISEVTEDKEYTALFDEVETYAVTFYDDDGTVLKSEEVSYGQDATPPSDPFKEGHIFDGWDQPYENITEDISIYATYIPEKYTVTWKNYDGGILETDLNVDWGAVPIYDGVTPTKEADDEYEYTFSGWSPEISEVTEDKEYTALFDEVETYTVTFYDDDGTVLKSEEVSYGEGVTPPNDPFKEGHIFDGWDQPYENITGNLSIYATYIPEKFTITWKNYDGEVLETDASVNWGEIPTYDGITPTKTIDDEHEFSFSGWSPEISEVTGNQEYTALFVGETYVVTFYDGDGTILKSEEVSYGEAATPPSDPYKEGHIFDGWDHSFDNITGNLSINATYIPETFTVTWKNYDDEILETDVNVAWKLEPTYDGKTPIKPGNIEFTYTFLGWSPNIEEITKDAEYIAIFEQTVNTYEITWKNYDGTILMIDTFKYGETPVYRDYSPIKPSTEQYTYTFSGWGPALSIVTGDYEYVAQYTSTINSFEVSFVDWNSNVLKREIVNYGDSATAPNNPSREGYTFLGWRVPFDNITGRLFVSANYQINTYSIVWKNYDDTILDANISNYGTNPYYYGEQPQGPTDAQYIYTFSGWSPELSDVTADQEYIAQYTQTVRSYTVEWKNYDGSILKTDILEYGSSPKDDGINPTRPSNNMASYIFSHWSPDLSTVTSNQEYIAVFDEILNLYTVTWCNFDGEILEIDLNVPHGTPSSYNGGTPVRENNAQYTYTFSHWSPFIQGVHGDMEYVAQYTAIENSYKIVFYDYDKTVLDEQTVLYGESADEPQHPDSKEWYHFSSWDVEFDFITNNLDVYAQYESSYYYTEENDELTITGYYDKNAVEVVVPTYLEGRCVIEIKEAAFYDFNHLINITLPFVGKSRNATGEESYLGYIFGKTEFSGQYDSYQAMGYYLPKNLRTVIVTDSDVIKDYSFSETEFINSVIYQEGLNVISIGKYAFAESGLSSFIIPNTVSYIGEYAFEWTHSLQLIIFEEGSQLTEIENYVFDSSTLSSIILPSSLTSIGEGAFRDCRIRSIIIPKNVTSIGDFAFSSTYYLETITFEESSQIEIIGAQAFQNSKITSILIPKSVKTISSNSFYVCESLESIDVEDGNLYYSSIDGVLFNIDENILIAYPGAKAQTSYTIPSTVTTIGDYAFAYADLSSVIIPNSVTSIGNYAFDYHLSADTGLESITFEASSNLKSIGSRAFYGALLQSIIIPNGVTDIGQYAFSNNYYLTYVYIPNTVTAINNCAFYQNWNLETVIFEENSQLTSIGSSVFFNAVSLKSIDIPDSVTSIGNVAFQNTEQLAWIVIPENVTYMGNAVFSGTNGTIIYCEVVGELMSWFPTWDYYNKTVYYRDQWEYVNGIPIPLI